MDCVDNLLERRAHLVKKVAWSVSSAAARDEDVLQSGMIGLWEAAKRWDGSRPFEPLARRCIRNNIIDHLRRKKEDAEELPDDLAAPEEMADDETVQELKARICRLFPRRSRERKILLSLLAGKKKDAIAARLGVSRSTVQRTARRAWERMAEQKRQGT